MDSEHLHHRTRNAETRKALGRFWYLYAAQNRTFLSSALESKKALPIHLVPRILSETPFTLFGNGPSLELLGEFQNLPRPWFCSLSGLSIFLQKGLQVDFAVLVDANPGLVPRILPLLEHVSEKTVLITTPCVPPEILESWPGPLILFRPTQEGNAFFTEFLPYMYPDLPVAFASAGCVVNSALECANYLGYGPGILAGVDLSYTYGKYRATTYTPKGKKWVPDEPFPAQIFPMRVIGSLRTTEEMVAYKLNLYLVMFLDSMELYRVGQDGLLYELPVWDPEHRQPVEYFKQIFLKYAAKQDLKVTWKDGKYSMVALPGPSQSAEEFTSAR